MLYTGIVTPIKALYRGILAVEDSYETKDLLLEWEGVNGVDHDKDMDLPQFQLVSEKTITTSAVYKIGT